MSSVSNENKTDSSNSGNTAADSHDDNDVTRFREQHLYRPQGIPDGCGTQANPKIVIFGLQDGCGFKVFDEYFNSEYSEETLISKYDKNVEIKVKVLSSYSENEQSKVLVNRSQRNTHLLTSTAYVTLEQLANEPSCFVVVFDGAFHRFSSDCDKALRLLEKCFGPNVWRCTTLIVVNPEKVFGNKPTQGYFKEEKDSLMGRWAIKMGNGVLALPSSDNEFSKEFKRKEVVSLIGTSPSYCSLDFYRKIRWWCYALYWDFKRLIGL